MRILMLAVAAALLGGCRDHKTDALSALGRSTSNLETAAAAIDDAADAHAQMDQAVPDPSPPYIAASQALGQSLDEAGNAINAATQANAKALVAVPKLENRKSFFDAVGDFLDLMLWTAIIVACVIGLVIIVRYAGPVLSLVNTLPRMLLKMVNNEMTPPEVVAAARQNPLIERQYRKTKKKQAIKKAAASA